MRTTCTYRPTAPAHGSLLTAHSSLIFTFSAKEKDAESGLSYFGARYYSSDLSMWLSVDPMADKYPSLSPYVYCADNPVKLVDPNGEEIYVGDNYYYRNGCLYDKSTGELFTPDADSFEGKALNSLNKLKGTKQGGELMTPFEGLTGSDVNIVDADNRLDKKGCSGAHNEKMGGHKSITIYWNPKGELVPTNAGFLSNGTTDLGHEFSHAYDFAIGRTYEAGATEGIGNHEWMAVYRENLIRGELGLPYRSRYQCIKYRYTDSITWEEKTTIVSEGPKMLRHGQPYLPWK